MGGDNDGQPENGEIDESEEETPAQTANSKKPNDDKDDNINHIHRLACLHVPDPVGLCSGSFRCAQKPERAQERRHPSPQRGGRASVGHLADLFARLQT